MLLTITVNYGLLVIQVQWVYISFESELRDILTSSDSSQLIVSDNVDFKAITSAPREKKIKT